MATTSIWRVNGWLGKVLIYIENPDKTENPDFFEKQDMDGKEAQGLSDVIEYAVQQQKTGKAVESEGETVMRQFVSGVNCSPSTARDEMIAVKKRFGKEDGTVAYHGYQSFAPGEATPELAHEIGLALAKKLWGEKYQVLVATHLDRENHLHNHFVLNTVSFVDGIKYHRTEQDYFDMQRESDRLCREYGLSVIENPQRGKSKHYGEWRAEQEGRPTYLSLIKADVDTAIRQSMTERQFFYHLRQMGYDIKVGKDITVRPPNYLDVQSRFPFHSARNALLIGDKCPHAERIHGEKGWKDMGFTVLEEEKRLPIIILEPGKAYRREDGSVGQNFYAKEVYDISQTTARDQVHPQVSYDDRLLLKGLIASSPLPIRAVEELPQGRGAMFSAEQNAILVKKGMDAPDIFRCVSLEVANVQLAQSMDGYSRETDGYKAYAVSYMLCKRYGVDAKEYEISKLDGVFQGQVPREDIPAALTDMRDAFKSLNGRMARAMGLTRDSKQKEQER